jgi:predicted dehydrogenase
MSSDAGRDLTAKLGRRDFLSSAALPVAAAFVPSALSAQNRGTARVPPPERIRVGIIGAGGIVGSTHIPGLRRMPGVEIVAVANRSLDSSRRAAAEFNIPRAFATGEELLKADGIDAVLIGTWPYMHKDLTLAALDSGRHVLCQARMANTAAEAHEMLAASRRHPNLVCQLVPSSSGYAIDIALRRLLADRVVGDILSVDVHRLERGFVERDGEFDWRHNPEFSGINTLNIGAIYELFLRWLGPGSHVVAKTRVHAATRRDERGATQKATIPDHVAVLYELANGAPVHMAFSESTGLSRGNDTWIFGTEGTIHVDNANTIFVGRRGDRELAVYPNPPEGRFRHRVEEEFINAIRGLEQVTQNTFAIGVQYMEWTEAVHRSAASGRSVSLPLSI